MSERPVSSEELHGSREPSKDPTDAAFLAECTREFQAVFDVERQLQAGLENHLDALGRTTIDDRYKKTILEDNAKDFLRILDDIISHHDAVPYLLRINTATGPRMLAQRAMRMSESERVPREQPQQETLGGAGSLDALRDLMPNETFREHRDIFETPKDVQFWTECIRKLEELFAVEGHLQERLERHLLALTRETVGNRRQEAILENKARELLGALDGILSQKDGLYLLQMEIHYAPMEVAVRAIRMEEGERMREEQRQENIYRETKLLPAARAVMEQMKKMGVDRVNAVEFTNAHPEMAESMALLSNVFALDDRWTTHEEGGTIELQVSWDETSLRSIAFDSHHSPLDIKELRISPDA